jgi:hypothetical protein
MRANTEPWRDPLNLLLEGKTVLRRSLNAVCAYFTMFPLEFPLKQLRKHSSGSEWVLDPFCGRGTTNFAARLLGMPSVGIDSSPVAVAIVQSKRVDVSANSVVQTAKAMLDVSSHPKDWPEGQFWNWAYSKSTLNQICRVREALLDDCSDPARVVLRAILLGALHGPLNKVVPSYLS